jgi:dimethylglycine dehydrogenase
MSARLPFMGCGTVDVGLIRARVARCRSRANWATRSTAGAWHIALRRALLEAGAEFRHPRIRLQRAAVAAAGEELRHLVAEFTQGYTPGMTGMDRWIAWDKGDFIGREAAMKERDGAGPPRCW